jgi:YD repeat-containing protein
VRRTGLSRLPGLRGSDERPAGSPLRCLLIFAVLLFGLSAVPVFADPAGEAENPYAPTEAQLAQLPSAADTNRTISEAKEVEAELQEKLETPAAEAERAESQEAFAGVSAGEAASLLREEFPEQLAQLESDPARTLSDAKLDQVFGSEGAQVTVEGEPMLLEGSMPVRATDEEGELAKVDLDLEYEGGEFTPVNPLVDVSLPKEDSEGIEIGTGGLVVKPEGDGTARRLGEKDLLYYETAEDTDLLAAPLSGGVELSSVLRSAESPEDLRFEVGLPAGAQLQANGEGGATIVDKDGTTQGIVTPPSALDAQGAAVPVALHVEEGQIRLHVSHREQEFAYPIFVDPYYQLFESWDGDYGSWFSGHNLSALSPGIWNWNTNDGGRMWGRTTPIYHNWGGSERGLYASATSTSGWQSGGINGQWTYEVPGTSTYIVQAGITPFPRDNHNCGAAQYTIPMDFNGIWSPSLNRYVTFHLDDSNNSGWSMNAPNFAESGANTGRILALGLTTWNGGTAIPCWRDIYAGGASVYLDDLESPTLTSVTGAPTKWVNGSEQLAVQVAAGDNGLGVKNIKIVNEGGPAMRLVPEQSECSGLKQNTCLSSASGTIKFTGAAFPEGESTATVIATDPTQKISNSYPWTMKVDRTSPELNLSGQLASITNEAGSSEHAGNEKAPGEDDELSLPSYQLTIKASDGDATKKRSGVKNIEIFLDKKTTPESVPWAAQECKTYSCSMEKTYTLNLGKLTPGPHVLNVVAVDQVGNKTTPERKIEFEYVPATGLKDEYVLQRIPLPDGKDHSAEEEPDGPELAVNVINGNLVYHQQDLESEATDLQLERFYNSQLPDEENTEWGDGWTLAEAPDLDIESTGGGKGPVASVLGKTGSVDHSIGLPGEVAEPTFDPQLQATIAKAPGGGYEVTGEKTGGVSLYSGEGQILESRPAATGAPESPSKATVAATTLCKTNAQRPECLTDDRYRAAATAIAASASEAKFETSLGNVVCSGSSLGAEASAEAGEPLPARITAWTLASCVLGATSCSATTQNVPAAASLKATAAGNGELKAGSGSKAPGWALKCGTALECTVSFEPALTAEGGSSPRLVASKKTMSRTGAKCPTEAKFSATYTLSTPKPLYLEGLGFPGSEPILRYSYSGKNLTKIAQAQRGVELRPAIDMQLSSGLVASTSGAAGSSSYAYTSGQLTSAQSPEGKTTYEYDSGGRLTKIKLPNETTATIAYEATYSRVTSVKVDPAGPEGVQTTSFAYTDNPRETSVTPPAVPAISYKIGADGGVFKWQAVKQPPAFDQIGGTLWEKRNTTTPVPAGDQTFSATAKAIEGVALTSIQLVKDGNQLVAEKTCTDDPETKANECIAPLTLKWVTNTASMAPGYANFEVIASDGLGQSVSERFADYIPVTPPPTPGVPVDPSYSPTLEFREEFGLDIDLKGNKEAIEARVWKSLANWELGDPVARASMDEWGVPLFPADVAELEYRERYVDQAATSIPKWASLNGATPDYAGYYVDHRAGGLIYVGFTSNQATRVAALKESGGLIAPDRLRPFPIQPTSSISYLEGLQLSIVEASDSPSTMGGAKVNPEKNIVEVGATNVSQVDGYIDFHFGSGAPVYVYYEAATDQPSFARIKANPSGPVESGEVLEGISELQPELLVDECSAGWGVWDIGGTTAYGENLYRHFITTAGHCFVPGAEVKQWELVGPENEPKINWERRIGDVRRYSLEKHASNFGTDAEAVRVDDSSIVPRVIRYSDTQAKVINGVTTIKEGMVVCRAGQSSPNIKCGPAEWPPKCERWGEVRENHNPVLCTIRAEIPIALGDSGGPYWERATTKAVGTLTGGISNASWFTPVEEIPGYPKAPGILNALSVENQPLHVVVWR